MNGADRKAALREWTSKIAKAIVGILGPQGLDPSDTRSDTEDEATLQAKRIQRDEWARSLVDDRLAAAGLTPHEAGPGLAEYLTSLAYLPHEHGHSVLQILQDMFLQVSKDPTMDPICSQPLFTFNSDHRLAPAARTMRA